MVVGREGRDFLLFVGVSKYIPYSMCWAHGPAARNTFRQDPQRGRIDDVSESDSAMSSSESTSYSVTGVNIPCRARRIAPIGIVYILLPHLVHRGLGVLSDAFNAVSTHFSV